MVFAAWIVKLLPELNLPVIVTPGLYPLTDFWFIGGILPYSLNIFSTFPSFWPNETEDIKPDIITIEQVITSFFI